MNPIVKSKKTALIVRLLALAVAFALAIPTGVTHVSAASVMPRASAYLESYCLGIAPIGDGVVCVEFDVTGTDYMDVLGFMSITLYESTDCENWEPVENFHWTDYPEMLGYNFYCHGGWVEYQGVAGRYYMALASVYAGKGEGYDTDEFYSNPVMAT